MMNDEKLYSVVDDVALGVNHLSTKAAVVLQHSPAGGLFVFPFRASVNAYGVH